MIRAPADVQCGSRHTGIGPSPRPWGKQRRCRVQGTAERTIPTPVGKTRSVSAVRTQTPDHPHARGENEELVEKGAPVIGPSPRPWGKLCNPLGSVLAWRTIPTPVGKTRIRPAAIRMISDHPHARGENMIYTCTAVGCSGPSPRPWGKLVPLCPGSVGERTIPTPVGKTVLQPHFHRPSSDHPHARGENQIDGDPTTAQYGPSPRPWGKHAGCL